MRVDEFDFDLPEDRIALRPCDPRDSAKLLQVDNGLLTDRVVSDLPSLLQPGDLLVFNDTRVIPAQFEAVRVRNGLEGPRIGLTMHMRLSPSSWKAFARGAKKLTAGDRLAIAEKLSATVLDKADGGEVTLEFDQSGPALDVAFATYGHVPLPPYIASKRSDDERDRTDYQTVYAENDGAVAAPTAGLHFTASLLERLGAGGINRAFVTLHVGAGTFLPVKADDTRDHVMHAEIGQISSDTANLINQTKKQGGRVIAVGTTSLRLLETAASDDGTIAPWAGSTDIFITPGYRFKCPNMLMTNFHLPRSTLMMLVCAFAGMDEIRAAYRHAIESEYRFYSYGDASLLTRNEP